jgi:hypothetical protein
VTADGAGDWLARAVAVVSERAGGDPDVVRLVEAIARPAVRRALARGKRGGQSARRAFAIERRNEALRALRAGRWPDLSIYAAAVVMRAAFDRYASDRWPRERAAMVAPIGEPFRTFWVILRDHEADGPPMPDVRRLATVLGD